MTISIIVFGGPATVVGILEFLVCSVQDCLRFFSRVGGVAGVTDLGLRSRRLRAAGRFSVLPPLNQVGLVCVTPPNQTPQHNAYACPFSAFLVSPVRRG
jgi:hypothetical protein